MYFIEGLSQKETGERIGLSQMHVSRLQRTAVKITRSCKTINELLTVLVIKSVIIAWNEFKNSSFQVFLYLYL